MLQVFTPGTNFFLYRYYKGDCSELMNRGWEAKAPKFDDPLMYKKMLELPSSNGELIRVRTDVYELGLVYLKILNEAFETVSEHTGSVLCSYEKYGNTFCSDEDVRIPYNPVAISNAFDIVRSWGHNPISLFIPEGVRFLKSDRWFVTTDAPDGFWQDMDGNYGCNNPRAVFGVRFKAE